MNSKLYTFFITIVATLGGLLFGYDTGVIGGTQLYFTEYFELDKVEQGWAVSSALIGCVIGAISAGYFSNKISRKYSLILSAILFTLSAWGSAKLGIFGDPLDHSYVQLIVYRIVGGLGVGMASMVAPMYIAEIAPPEKRGNLVAYYQVAIVVGFFVVFLVTYIIGGGNTIGLSSEEVQIIHHYNIEMGWRWMFLSEIIPCILFLVSLLFIPHSPRWLMLKQRYQDARYVLLKISSTKDNIENTLKNITNSLKVDQEQVDLVSAFKSFGFVLFLGITLSVLQQVTGINAILYYGAEIFSGALGYGPEDALKQQLILGTVNMLATFIAVLTVDKWGRKPLLITGTTGMGIGIITLGITIYTSQLGILSLISILIFIASFAMSMGPIVWVMLSEIFPNRIRNIAMSVAVAAQWISNFALALIFPSLVESSINEQYFNGGLPYFIFGAFCIVTIIFVLKYIPETKRRSLEELEKQLIKNQ